MQPGSKINERRNHSAWWSIFNNLRGIETNSKVTGKAAHVSILAEIPLCAQRANSSEISVIGSTEQFKRFSVPIPDCYRARVLNLTNGRWMQTSPGRCFCPRKPVSGKQTDEEIQRGGRGSSQKNRNNTNTCKRGTQARSP